MNVHYTPQAGEAQGQATFGMANLRMERTGLPVIVFISQRDDADHDVRATRSPAPRVRPDQTSSSALRPFRWTDGRRLASDEEALLRRWSEANLDALVSSWDGRIAYIEDAIASLVGI